MSGAQSTGNMNIYFSVELIQLQLGKFLGQNVENTELVSPKTMNSYVPKSRLCPVDGRVAELPTHSMQMTRAELENVEAASK
jgi:hypothetical protein